MSVSLDYPPRDATLRCEAGAATLTLTVRGRGPRRSPVFVNEAVVETDDEGLFTCEVSLEPGDGLLTAGLLTGCACVTQRVPVRVERG